MFRECTCGRPLIRKYARRCDKCKALDAKHTRVAKCKCGRYIYDPDAECCPACAAKAALAPIQAAQKLAAERAARLALCRTMREAGCTFQTIAEAIGTSRQYVHQILNDTAGETP